MNKRANNFSSQEVDKLVDLVDKYKNVIGNRKTDRASIDFKNEGWKKVEKEFNATFKHNMRSDRVLRTKYENIKRNAKRNYASVRLDHPEAKLTKVDKKILAICNSVLSDINMQSDIDQYAGPTLRGFKIEDEVSLDCDAAGDTNDGTENCKDTIASDSGGEADNDRESYAKLEAPCINSAPDNTGNETENDSMSWPNWQSNVKKSLRDNPLRIPRNRKCNKNAWIMIANKEISKMEEEMVQQKERHQLELKKMEQEMAEQRELHQLAVKKAEQELAHRQERHLLEMRKLEQSLT